jgi:hypothetical protein
VVAFQPAGALEQLSEIGDAFKAGHVVYFAGFTASHVKGQPGRGCRARTQHLHRDWIAAV